MSVRFQNVVKSFGARVILRGVSFETTAGEILFILGKSGTGKSVTLKNIVGLLKPDSGEVWVEGEPVHALDAEGLSRVRRMCGMVFQHPALLDSLSVERNVTLGLAHRKDLSPDRLRAIAIEKLGLVHLDPEILSRMPPEISYGMQKRVSLARTLAPAPRILLFDEPTTGLDPVTTEAVNDLILELSRKLSVTSIVVSHDMGSALRVADRILVLDEGKVLALGTPKEMRESPIPLIRDFLAEATA